MTLAESTCVSKRYDGQREMRDQALRTVAVGHIRGSHHTQTVASVNPRFSESVNSHRLSYPNLPRQQSKQQLIDRQSTPTRANLTPNDPP